MQIGEEYGELGNVSHAPDSGVDCRILNDGSCLPAHNGVLAHAQKSFKLPLSQAKLIPNGDNLGGGKKPFPAAYFIRRALAGSGRISRVNEQFPTPFALEVASRDSYRAAPELQGPLSLDCLKLGTTAAALHWSFFSLVRCALTTFT